MHTTNVPAHKKVLHSLQKPADASKKNIISDNILQYKAVSYM